MLKVAHEYLVMVAIGKWCPPRRSCFLIISYHIYTSCGLNMWWRYSSSTSPMKNIFNSFHCLVFWPPAKVPQLPTHYHYINSSLQILWGALMLVSGLLRNVCVYILRLLVISLNLSLRWVSFITRFFGSRFGAGSGRQWPDLLEQSKITGAGRACDHTRNSHASCIARHRRNGDAFGESWVERIYFSVCVLVIKLLYGPILVCLPGTVYNMGMIHRINTRWRREIVSENVHIPVHWYAHSNRQVYHKKKNLFCTQLLK